MGLVVIGGLKRIAKVSERVIPVMVVVYVGISLVLIIYEPRQAARRVRRPSSQSAFGLQAAAGGMLGAIIIAMQKGIARGIFSNEAGLGSAPIAAAAAQTKEPVRQGLVSMTGTFLGHHRGVLHDRPGAGHDRRVPDPGPGRRGRHHGGVPEQACRSSPAKRCRSCSWLCLALFGFTTILGWDYYGERCLEYFSNGSMKAVKVYRWLYIAAVFIGPYMTVAAVWTIADIFNGLHGACRT